MRHRKGSGTPSKGGLSRSQKTTAVVLSKDWCLSLAVLQCVFAVRPHHLVVVVAVGQQALRRPVPPRADVLLIAAPKEQSEVIRAVVLEGSLYLPRGLR